MIGDKQTFKQIKDTTYMDEKISFDDCPVGKLNAQEIHYTAESLSKDMNMAIEKLENKMDSMNTKMDTRFDSLDNKIDRLDNKIHILDEKLNGVDDIKGYVKSEIENNTKDKVFRFVRWLITVLLSSTAVLIIGRLALNLLHLN